MITRRTARLREGRGLAKAKAWLKLGVMCVAMSLQACGGGSDSSPEVRDPPAALPPTPAPSPSAPVVAIETPRQGSNLLNFEIDESIRDAQSLARFGNPLVARWNPRDPASVLTPGLKISFHGAVEGCPGQGEAGGPADAMLSSSISAEAAALTQVSLPDALAHAMLWMVRGDAALCDAHRASANGPSFVFLNPKRDAGGGVAMLTQSEPIGNDSTNPLMRAYGAGGVDGRGLNANGLGTFMGLRQAWWAGDAVKPFASSADNTATDLRLVSRQGVGRFDLGDDRLGGTVQVKQQIMMELINKTCHAERPTTTGPCQVQYLFNTAVARNGVTDWDQFAPPQQGTLWFDADQGGIPIVEGQLPSQGTMVRDKGTGLGLFKSLGNSTQHAIFNDLPFEIRISFEQLKNAMRMVTAVKTQRSVAEIQDSDLRAQWGSAWHDPQQWTLVHLSAGQEVYDDRHDVRRARIAGAIHQLYLGSLE